MILEEYKTYLAFEKMRQVAQSLGLKECEPTKTFPYLSKDIDTDFFICWTYARKTAAIFHSPGHGFSYVMPKRGAVIESIDNWQEAFLQILNSLGLEINIDDLKPNRENDRE